MSAPLMHIRFRFGLGDTVLATGLVRDIHRAYPGQYRIFADTAYSGLWQHNPKVVKPEKGERRQVVMLKYAVKQPTKIHFMRHLYDYFQAETRLTVPLTEPKGEIFLEPMELVRKTIDRYWVIIAGGKLDMTTKFWPQSRWQKVVDELTARNIVCIQAGALHAKHVHQPLNNVVNLLDQTNERELAALIANADGVVCGITAAMHMAAVFDKPCVVVAGGREEPWWEHYSNQYPNAFGPICSPVKMEHVFLHTIGKLDCCKDIGCWRPRTVPLAKEDMPRVSSDRLCVHPEKDDLGRPVPLCMNMIAPEEVVNAVLGYYEQGWLPSIPPCAETLKKFEKMVEMVRAGYTAPLIPLRLESHNVLLNKNQLDDIAKFAKGPAISIPWTGPPPSGVIGLNDDGTPKTARAIGIDHAQPGADRTEIVKLDAGLVTGTLNRNTPVGVIDDPIFDHPIIGGKLTVFVLCYGNYPDLARRCIDNILRTTPAGRIQLRILLNDCCKETIDYVRTLPYVGKVYLSEQNILKYPLMRRAFHDSLFPIQTKYLIWFDDDSYPCSPDWLNKLADQIVIRHPAGDRLFGWQYLHDLKNFTKGGHRPDNWFKAATWYRGEPFLVDGHRKAPNGSMISFVAGGFWALHTDTMRQAQIPDARLTHHGGDIVIGAQVAQAGYGICNFNIGKKFVFSSGHEPRGASMTPATKPYPWKGTP